MQVKNALPGIRAGVQDQPVTALANLFLPGQPLRDNEQVPQQRCVFFADLVERVNMAVGNDQQMDRRGSIAVPERGSLFVFIDDLRRCFPGKNPAKNTVFSHFLCLCIISPGRAVERTAFLKFRSLRGSLRNFAGTAFANDIVVFQLSGFALRGCIGGFVADVNYIVDDRKTKQYYEDNFFPFLKQFGWTITNAWISAKDTPDYLWKENEEVMSTGLVDPQAHGVVHNVNIGEGSTDDFIRGELNGSISAIQQHFGKTPIGFIWPGGGFSKRAIELAREAGYRVGFTTNPRGPVMFNWVPLADKLDPAHTDWLPEISVNDPRMVLPRYWSKDAAYRIDDVINIGNEAADAAAKSKATELEYYDIVCKSRTGEIPQAAP